MMYDNIMIRTSLSEPHTSGTADCIARCVCMSVHVCLSVGLLVAVCRKF